MSRTPFTRFFQGDFLARMQAAGLEGDEIGVYMVAWALMAERRGPIPDDMAWLGRRSGTSTRRAKQIRAKLIEAGLWLARDGQLGDPVVLGEVAHQNRRSATNRSNALERWDRNGQPELDFDENAPNEPRKRRKYAQSSDANASEPAAPDAGMRSGEKSGEKARENGSKTELENDLIPQETAENSQSTPTVRMKDSRTRATPEPELEYQATESESCLPREPGEFFQSVCEAAGFNPRKPEHTQLARATFDEWIGQGIDAEETIIPTIRAVIAKGGDDPTSSLSRFDRHIRHAHARRAATPKSRAPPPGPPSPAPADDDPRFEQIRSDLLRDVGPRAYDGWLKPIHFSAENGTLAVTLPSQFMRDWVHSHFGERLALEATLHGFNRCEVRAGLPTQYSKPGRASKETGEAT